MCNLDITAPIFHDEDKAREHLEAIRWPDGAVCPSCGMQTYVRPLGGKSMGPGWYHCKQCRQKFTVRVGTVYERSKIPLHKWVLATHLLTSSKKGMSAHQLHRMLGVTYKTAWFMAHRIREAMAPLPGSEGPLGGEGKAVEADEAFVGGQEKYKHRRKRNSKAIGGLGKKPVFSLVERGGNVRSIHVPNVTAKTLRPILVAQVDRKSTLMTDGEGQYRLVGREFAGHEVVNHGAEEYVRGDAYTNTVEGYFSILKRGITGVYHHVSQQHFKRYLGEFDFRYNGRKLSDTDRATLALKGIEGKRLTYRRTGDRPNV